MLYLKTMLNFCIIEKNIYWDFGFVLLLYNLKIFELSSYVHVFASQRQKYELIILLFIYANKVTSPN